MNCVVLDLGWCFFYGGLIISPLSSLQKHLLEVARNILHRSLECAMDHSEPLVMTHNMSKHDDLLFHRGMDAIF
jgi:hypothetical protein